MLRITVQTEKIGAILQLEGRLAGSLVKEAAGCLTGSHVEEITRSG